MSLNPPEPFEGGIESKAVTSSLLGEVSLLKVGYFSFVSPVSASTVSKPIFDIKATEEKKPRFLHLCFLYESKMPHPLVLWL